jgi:hypothetical protein
MNSLLDRGATLKRKKTTLDWQQCAIEIRIKYIGNKWARGCYYRE